MASKIRRKPRRGGCTLVTLLLGVVAAVVLPVGSAVSIRAILLHLAELQHLALQEMIWMEGWFLTLSLASAQMYASAEVQLIMEGSELLS